MLKLINYLAILGSVLLFNVSRIAKNNKEANSYKNSAAIFFSLVLILRFLYYWANETKLSFHSQMEILLDKSPKTPTKHWLEVGTSKNLKKDHQQRYLPHPLPLFAFKWYQESRRKISYFTNSRGRYKGKGK